MQAVVQECMLGLTVQAELAGARWRQVGAPSVLVGGGIEADSRDALLQHQGKHAGGT